MQAFYNDVKVALFDKWHVKTNEPDQAMFKPEVEAGPFSLAAGGRCFGHLLPLLNLLPELQPAGHSQSDLVTNQITNKMQVTNQMEIPLRILPAKLDGTFNVKNVNLK